MLHDFNLYSVCPECTNQLTSSRSSELMNETIFFQHKQRATYNTTTGKSINAKKKAKNRQPNIN